MWCHFLREREREKERPPKNHLELDEICAIRKNTLFGFCKKPEQNKIKQNKTRQKKKKKEMKQNKTKTRHQIRTIPHA